ncbi:hypothetical protein A2344_00015 [Candidatus Peregrinibacteria bacterium RIFOXYB12_FULL_41_12]|nr:MAG: hypothetical protein A2244_04675 [Candidatus Peregrinibacteria bacterium RIFOXYA2_FULL_41_18]OGJ48980.1 MAG: hypothetical protein A2344_00015 [Candidatus Peregrinibacteria bacterium RIFOXYB12_FULL_41_12]OGJ54505.1 MAG: hypothetical protein A2336_00350 [Candidatus Peregrinibacteria bacterium RIFOXYB2_FULL_41_88]
MIAISGCAEDTVIETENQSYYVANLVGDPSNRNVFRSTTAWSNTAAFEMLIPDYWEIKMDEDDLYNTDIYMSSDEYDNDSCIVLAGTVGYGISDEYEKEIWQTTTSYGVAEDYYFYERISDTEKRPVLRIVTFSDAEENYYILEARFPETDYESCSADFSNMVATFSTLDIELEETYVEEEIFQPKWISLVLNPYGTEGDEYEIIVDYPPNWVLTNNEGDKLSQYIITDQETSCETYAGAAQRDLTGLTYSEDVLVLDNNEIATKYIVTTETGETSMEIVTFVHDELTYSFELRNIDQSQIATCMEEFESVVKSFRTYAEEMEAKGVTDY